MTLQDIESWISIIANVVLIGGIVIAIAQLYASFGATKAQFIAKLAEDWQKDELLPALRYVHNIRREWKLKLADLNKESEIHVYEWKDMCEKFAEDWVSEHVGKSIKSEDESERRLAEEWILRRKASQFLAKMGLLMIAGYLKPHELFRGIPEMGRLLIVLIPIELSIEKHFSGDEEPLRSWDKPVPKWEFQHIWEAHSKWHKKGWKKLGLKPIDWNLVT